MSRQAPHAAMERATRAMFTRILATLARSLRDEELSVAQAAGLHLIDHHRQLTIGELAEALAVSMPMASRLADDLVRRAWVIRSESPTDRRVRLLELSSQGAAFMQQASDDRVAAILEVIPQIMPASVMRLVFSAVAKRFAPKPAGGGAPEKPRPRPKAAG